ncbi:uncharacterized protein GGS22DRAFT_187658 [Annulohypoxylon maeteangense]|uniref:uncharacterized protein n=1 Tax=Annulohypoxylon maeteangense TaxID=1927788 RepID=UPI00200826AF|nr:uncharacterized protein GGS22DRAFT_187658 [Annulohypoxylon maeteangense]KAI0886416.1 hypothetical protein GGS22DRAFT_187658 [Annulohypoxylon maeteangense]
MHCVSFSAFLVLAFIVIGLATPIPDREMIEIDAAEGCTPAEPVAHGTLNSRDEVRPRCVIKA